MSNMPIRSISQFHRMVNLGVNYHFARHYEICVVVNNMVFLS